MRFNFEKRIFRISINPGDGLQFFLKNGMYLILKLKDLLKNSGSKSVNGSGPGLEPGGLVPLHVRVVFPRQMRSWWNGSHASLRNWCPQGVRVRVSPTALSSSNRKSYFARNGFSFEFGSNYAVQIRLFTLLIFSTLCPDGGIGSHAGFKLQCP